MLGRRLSESESKKTNCIPDAETVSLAEESRCKVLSEPSNPVEEVHRTTRNQEWGANSAALTSVSQEDKLSRRQALLSRESNQATVLTEKKEERKKRKQP